MVQSRTQKRPDLSDLSQIINQHKSTAISQDGSEELHDHSAQHRPDVTAPGAPLLVVFREIGLAVAIGGPLASWTHQCVGHIIMYYSHSSIIRSFAVNLKCGKPM